MSSFLKTRLRFMFKFLSDSFLFFEMNDNYEHDQAILYTRIISADWSWLLSNTIPKIVSLCSFYSSQLKRGSTAEEILLKLPSDVLHPALKSIQHEDLFWRKVFSKLSSYVFPNLSSTGFQLLNEILSTNVLIPSIDLACSK